MQTVNNRSQVITTPRIAKIGNIVRATVISCTHANAYCSVFFKAFMQKLWWYLLHPFLVTPQQKPRESKNNRNSYNATTLGTERPSCKRFYMSREKEKKSSSPPARQLNFRPPPFLFLHHFSIFLDHHSFFLLSCLLVFEKFSFHFQSIVSGFGTDGF